MMCSVLIVFASVLSWPGPVAKDAPGTLEWSVFHNRVHVGGCLQVIVEAPARLANQCELSIGDDAPPRSLDRLGPSLSSGGRTVVLISHDLTRPELVESTLDGSGALRIPPIFREPGAVTLTLYLHGGLVGTEEIEVIPPTDAMGEAIELLFPVVDRNTALLEREGALRWIRMATVPSYGVAPPITGEQLQQIRDELPTIKQHPDWAEIAEMLVARLEARAHYSGLIDQAEGRSPMLNVSGDVLPPWPAIVTRCLQSKPKSLFGHIIQKDIRGLAREIQILDAKRRGDDIWPIYEQAAKEKP